MSWTYDASFYEIMNVRGVGLSVNNSIVGLEFGGDHDPEATSPICFEGFAMGSCVTRLSCDHMYHRNCIARWWIRSNSCPLCRRVF